MINLAVNEIIQWHDDQGKVINGRIVWIDEGNIIAFIIDIFSSNGFPEVKTIRSLVEELESGRAIKLANDPFAKIVKEEELNQKAKEIRDKAWQIISSIVGPESEPAIFYRDKRGKLVKEVAQKFEVTEKTVYKYIRKFWQRGKNINSLLPDYDKSGGKGKEKKAGEKKRGRPSKFPFKQGINVDEDTKKIFRIAINRYYHTEKENSLTTAYDFMIRNFYAEDYRYEGGVRKPILIPQEQIPSFRQFKYWYEKESNIKQAISLRKGRKKYDLNYRPILGTSNSEVIGPGSRFQIDATVGDVYLVSRYNRNWIIGKPVIYAVIDVFSRIIAGIYVGLEGPSWIGAMMALANAATNKAKFCKEYDIDISEEEWPCNHVPEAILADRGEMEGKMVETLINSLQVRIENTPPYRADWKGIVEQYFRTTNEKVKPVVPGYIIKDFRQRGGKDYRLDAKLDLFQFTQIIIKCVLFHNNEHWMKSYEREEMAITDDVKPIPIELWKWGIANRSGKLRRFPEDIVKLNLMPAAQATVTARGIKFKRPYYSCERAVKEMWFDKARNKGTWKVDISYDPRNMNTIYLRNVDGNQYETCFLLESNDRYLDKSLDEIEYLLQHEELEKTKRLNHQLQAKSDLFSDIEGIVQRAETMTSSVQNNNASKASRLKGIKENRIIEKALNREKEAFILENKKHPNKASIIPLNEQFSENEGEDYPSKLDLLRKKQKEKLHGKTD